MIENNKIGITLSGGGFKGIAHLGVIQYLNELDIKLDAISGTSAGALVGAFIAEGYEPLEIVEIAKNEKIFTYTDFSMKDGGLFSADIFGKIIKKYIPHDSFEGLKIPLYVAVTDLTYAETLIFNQGNLSFAVKSSSCFPMVFQPVVYQNDRYLCDGGLLNNFPIEQILATCNKSIGVNINPINKSEGKMGYKDVIQRIIRITTSDIKNESWSKCDIFLQPEEINKFNTFDTEKVQEIYDFGYEYAQQFTKEFLKMKEEMEIHKMTKPAI